MKENNRTLTVFITLLLITPFLHAQSPTFEWAIHMGGKGIDLVNHITTDVQGNVFVTGVFMDTVDFDPGPGVANLISTNSEQSDVFIQKLDENGNLLWVRQMGGIRNDYGYSGICDLEGNIFTTGNFQQTVDFDPGPGITNLTSIGQSDIFIQKLDTDGNFVWVKQMGGIYDDTGYDITIDVDGNIITTGYFQKTIDFDPGPEVADLTSEGKLDIFIQKLDANGNFLWAKAIGGVFDDKGHSVSTDANGNVFTTGFYNKRVDFDPGESTFYLQAYYEEDIYIQKLDSDGNFIWVKSMGGSGRDLGGSCFIDANGNVYTTGHFDDTVDFDPGPDEINFTSAGEEDIFIQKLDNDGNFIWAKQMGGLKGDGGNTINTDADGNVYTSGTFRKTVDFDPGVGESYLTSNGSYDMFIQKLDGNGNFQWVKQMGGAGAEFLYSTALDAAGNIYSTGVFNYMIDFDPEGGNASFAPAGWNDIFVQKLSESTVSIIENNFSDNLFVYPNPANNKIQLNGKITKGYFRLYNIHGEIILSETIIGINQSIDISSVNPGVYIWKTGNRQGKLMVK